MSVTVRLHPYFQEFTKGEEVVQAAGVTVREIIEDLERHYPGMKEHLLDRKGRVQGFVEVFVNEEIVYPEEAGKAVKEGDEIEILTIVAGG